MQRAELVLDCANHHGEGVLWNAADGRVWWTDIHGQALWSLDPATGAAERRAMPGRVACFAPRAGGGFLLAFADAIALGEGADPGAGHLARIHAFEPDAPGTRLNDGRTDRQGRMIVGGMNEADGAPTSSVVQVAADLSVRTVIEGVSCANATCFSPDGRTMYFADSPERVLRAYPYDPQTGALGARRDLADLRDRPGVPDGACVDAEGGVWIAMWEGGCVLRVTPDGRVDRAIPVPVAKPTCCAFGGPGLDTLFITTSRLMSTAEDLAREPSSGGLYAVVPGVRGLTDAPFAG